MFLHNRLWTFLNRSWLTVLLTLMLLAFNTLLSSCAESSPTAPALTASSSPNLAGPISTTTQPTAIETIMPPSITPTSPQTVANTTPVSTQTSAFLTTSDIVPTLSTAVSTVSNTPTATVEAGKSIRRCDPAISPPLSPDGIGDAFYPQLGDAGYYIQHYTIDLTSNFPSKAISATVTLQARAQQSLNSFDLDFQGFSVSDIKIDNNVATYTRTANKLIIKLPQSMQSGQNFLATISYVGEPQPQKSTAIPIPIGWLQFSGGTFVLSEPSGAEGWFPVNDHPCDKATYSIRVTAPKPYNVATNGELKSTQDNGTTRTFQWETRDPVAPYLITLGIGDYVEQTQVGPNQLPIRNFFPPSIAAQAAKVFSPTADIIQFYSERFGPYPFEAYGALVVDTNLAASLETQTLSLFGRNIVLSSQQAEIAVPHELAHQWFGDSVSLKSWKDIWLNEGFATYAESLWYEHTHGTPALAGLMRELYNQQKQKPDPPPGNPPPNNLFNKGVYNRGALTLHALRLKLGDEVFFRILRTYAERYRYGNASTADFVAVANQVSGQDLKAFFNAWLYNPVIPAIPEMGL